MDRENCINCGVSLPEDRSFQCEECEPSEEEIEFAKKEAQRYVDRFQSAADRVEQKMKECSDCDTPEDGPNSLCDKHSDMADAIFGVNRETEVLSDYEKHVNHLENQLNRDDEVEVE